ncbi:YdaU family protein [Uliginosibacterium sediminicola]|uniref:YdaU family protein n=1 Tax=Uliginosibacterium sediminicola TaxID=2024550 RepID=A0ABU9YW43_9RHOO
MNYYEHHIRDYDTDTSHLTWVEDMAYTRILRLYYRKEKPVPADVKEVCRLVRATTREQREAVESVLNEFFVLHADGWRNETCDAVIAEYLAGEPEREARRANEQSRVRRHRAERAQLFRKLTETGRHASWNIGIKELRAMAGAIENNNLHPGAPDTEAAAVTTHEKPETLNETAHVTPATATQTPDTRHQTPDTKVNPSSPHSSPAAQEGSSPKVRKYSYSDADMDCAKWLYAELLTIRPELKQPNLEAWANEVRLMIEQDSRKHREICALMRWACNDAFWRGNIMSPDKLRKQYDQLAIKARAGSAPSSASRQEALEARNRAVDWRPPGYVEKACGEAIEGSAKEATSAD